jgi:transcriptional regulator with XRE-family HTH domain
MTLWSEHKKTLKSVDKDTLSVIDTLANLVSQRIFLGIGQKEFAERIGMTQPQLAKLEKLDSVPTLYTLNRYAYGLGYQITLKVTQMENAANSTR